MSIISGFLRQVLRPGSVRVTSSSSQSAKSELDRLQTLISPLERSQPINFQTLIRSDQSLYRGGAPLNFFVEPFSPLYGNYLRTAAALALPVGITFLWIFWPKFRQEHRDMFLFNPSASAAAPKAIAASHSASSSSSSSSSRGSLLSSFAVFFPFLNELDDDTKAEINALSLDEQSKRINALLSQSPAAPSRLPEYNWDADEPSN